jgi:transposase
LSRKKELRKFSKSQLIDIILNLEERINKIENYIKAFDNPHTPSSRQIKKNTKQKEQEDKKEPEDKTNKEKDDKEKKPRFPGKPNGSNGGGIKLPEPDDTKEHTLDVSPVSGMALGEPIGYRIQTVIDFPDKPIQTIQHIIYQYKDPKTGDIVEPKVDLPKGVYGKNIRSITVMLKELVNSHDRIADFMRELGAPSFSSATVQNISTMFILGLEQERNKILEEIKQEEYLNADETGLRKDGVGGQVWGIFTNLRAIYNVTSSRASYHFKKLIRNFKNVIVVDGYGGYDYYPLKQRCWAHLIREFKDYAGYNKEIEVQYKRIKALYETLKLLNEKPPDEKEIEKVKWLLGDIVICLKVIKEANGLVTLIENGGDDWFTALYYESVPLHNNHAERELRPVVLLRKAIGCYRNWKGKRWIDVVLSVIHTWRLQGRNIFQLLKATDC